MRMLKIILILCLLFNDSMAQVYDQRKVDEEIMLIIYNELIAPKVDDKDREPDWNEIQNSLNRYGSPGNEIGLRSRAFYYFNTKQYVDFAIHMSSYFEKYKNTLNDPIQLNNFAFEVFKHLAKKRYLKSALRWTEAAIAMIPGQLPHLLDTKANLLYKIGNRKEAIRTQLEAIALAKSGTFVAMVPELENVLQKMQSGNPTW